MRSQTFEHVRQIVATLFEVPVESVTLSTSAATLPKWDSMGHLMLVLQLELEMNLRLAPEEIEAMTSVGEIVDILTTRQKSAS